MPNNPRHRRAGLSNARQLILTLGLTFVVGGPLMWWLLGKEEVREQKIQAEQFLRTQADIAARHSTHDKMARDLARKFTAMTQPIPRGPTSTSPSSR